MLNVIYNFWQANPHLWFSATANDDIYIAKLFKDAFTFVTDKCITAETIPDIIQWTGYVILYDQIRRHINRVTDKSLTPSEPIKLPITFITDCYTKYKEFSSAGDSVGDSVGNGSVLSDFEFMFCLMPLRHTHDMCHVKFVIDESWHRLETSKSPEIKRYLTATYERYSKLCINRDADNLVNMHTYDAQYPTYDTQYLFNPEVLTILDSRCNEYIPNKLIICDDCDETNPQYYLIRKMRNFITQHNLAKERITISLSGGVDSMVCSYLLYVIDQPMQAVHINYNNRAECPLEEELLTYWCQLLGIPLYIRRLTEINRPKCMEYNMREVYESYTRDMRFYAYANANTNANCDSALDTATYVMLGHNKDDTIENILTNTASQSQYANLCGMTEYSTQDHFGRPLTILRPLLAIMKQDIYTFAKDANIPHLVDSTPKWSQRGKIRDIVRPALESWNPLIIPGFIELSTKMTEMTKLLDLLIPKTIPEFETINIVPTNNMYWEQVFKRQSLNGITQKTLVCWIEKLEYLQKYPNKLILNHPIKFVICKNKIITITKTLSCIKINMH